MDCELVRRPDNGLMGGEDIGIVKEDERVAKGRDVSEAPTGNHDSAEMGQTVVQKASGEGQSSSLSLLPDIWKEIEHIMVSDPAGDSKTTFEISNKLNQIIVFLVEENYCGTRNEQTCFQLCLELDIFNRVYEWMTKNKLIMKDMATELLTLYSKLLTLCSDDFFNSEAILEPMLVLMLALRPDEKQRLPRPLEISYLRLLNNLSLRLVNPKILDIFSVDRVSKEGYKLPKYSFLSLILHYVHRDGEVGDLARDSLLVCMQLTACHEEFAQFVVEESSCCALNLWWVNYVINLFIVTRNEWQIPMYPSGEGNGWLACVGQQNHILQVTDSKRTINMETSYKRLYNRILAAGLTGFYSLLPATLSIAAEDWHCLTRETCETVPELGAFLRGLLFLCEVVKSSHRKVYKRIMDLIYDGFFLSVAGPALIQPSTEGRIAAVAFLDLMLREVTDPIVMRQFLRFILLSYCDGKPLLKSIVSYISHDSPQLCIAALQLFKTLADLNCEDVIYHLVLRYLIPCNHILPNQKRIIKELDFYCKSATMFLYLIPNCCLENSKICKARALNGYLGDGVEKDEEKPALDDLQLGHLAHPLSLDSFMSYLHSARFHLYSCKKACHCWSAVYDGMDVMTELPRRRSTLRSGRGNSSTSADSKDDNKRSGSNASENTRSPSFLRDMRLRSLTSDSREFKHPTDCLGPFINALFDRIELMMENNFYVNLALTELISRIACYPQPLLRSFLLNSNLVLQPGVRSLFQILTTVANKTDMFVSQIEEHQRLLFTARGNLFKRQEHLSPPQPLVETGMEDTLSTGSNDSGIESSLGGSVEFLSVSKGTRLRRFASAASQNTLPVKKEKDGKRSSSVVSSPSPGASIVGLLHPVIRHSPRSPVKRPRGETSPLKIDILQRRKNQVVIRNAVYCALTLEEWLQELAAISLEQNLL